MSEVARPQPPLPRVLPGAGRGGGDPFGQAGLPLAPEGGPQAEAAPGSSPRRRRWPFWETGFLFGSAAPEEAGGRIRAAFLSGCPGTVCEEISV